MKTLEEIKKFVESMLPFDPYFGDRNDAKSFEYQEKKYFENLKKLFNLTKHEEIHFVIPYLSTDKVAAHGFLFITNKRMVYGSYNYFDIMSMKTKSYQKIVELKAFKKIEFNFRKQGDQLYQSNLVIHYKKFFKGKIVLKYLSLRGADMKDPVQILQEKGLEKLLYDLKNKYK